jgi:hypothetical protein
MKVKLAVIASAMLIGTAGLATLGAQKPVTKTDDVMHASATIERIDTTLRLVTFKDQDGTESTVFAGPEFARFSELKVGDRVKLTYYSSRVFKVRKPGDPPLKVEAASMTPSGGKLPGGTLATQSVRTVTVKAIDAKVPSITVTTSDGRVVSSRVEDRNNLTGVKVGDKIDIVYTEAVLASVERGK